MDDVTIHIDTLIVELDPATAGDHDALGEAVLAVLRDHPAVRPYLREGGSGTVAVSTG
jgi:hypothetical protein